MLELLAQYADKQGLAVEPGFTAKSVRWAISLDADGRLLTVLELGDADKKRNPGQRFKRCPDLSQPELKRGGAGTRHFLVDSADVVTLLTRGEPDSKLLAKHAYFVEQMRLAAAALPVMGTVAETLSDEETLAEMREQLDEKGAKPTDKVTFHVEGQDPKFLVDASAWHPWWREHRKQFARPPKKGKKGQEPAKVRCLVSGELVKPAPTHPKIKGLADVGGLAMGDVVAAFKQLAFRSYGLEQAANSPVSTDMAAAYRAGLNHLLRTTGKRLGSIKVVHWFKESVPPKGQVLDFLAGDDPATAGEAREKARKLLEALESGERPPWMHDNIYYVLTLSGASGRVMLRDFQEGSFEELVRRVNAWFDHFAIVRQDGSGLAPPPRFYSILAGLVRDVKDLPAPLETALWRAAVSGGEIPREAAARALGRVRSAILKDESLRYTQLGLLKAFVHRVKPTEETHMTENVNPDHPEAAYQCGRLMAVLANLQRRALGNVGAGVVQRYYSAASATPALVFGRLLRTAQFHLHKLDPGLAYWHEERIAEVTSKIGDYMPPTLGLEHQSLFALGYYQQIAADRAGKTDTPETETPEAGLSRFRIVTSSCSSSTARTATPTEIRMRATPPGSIRRPCTVSFPTWRSSGASATTCSWPAATRCPTPSSSSMPPT